MSIFSNLLLESITAEAINFQFFNNQIIIILKGMSMLIKCNILNYLQLTIITNITIKSYIRESLKLSLNHKHQGISQ
jgi:hypothetical protein